LHAGLQQNISMVGMLAQKVVVVCFIDESIYGLLQSVHTEFGRLGTGIDMYKRSMPPLFVKDY
jgi:hypothetical protein